MDREQGIVFIQCQIACMMARMEAMKAENIMRLDQGKTIAYGEDAFDALCEEYGVHQNAVLTWFEQFN